MDDVQPQPNRWDSVKTMAVGATIGALNGVLSDMTDSAWPFNWILLREIQKVLAKAIVNDAHRNGEIVDANLLENTAWITSWLAYLAVFPKIVIEHRCVGPIFVVRSTSIRI